SGVQENGARGKKMKISSRNGATARRKKEEVLARGHGDAVVRSEEGMFLRCPSPTHTAHIATAENQTKEKSFDSSNINSC
ncbi:MAG: hypothetical protein V5B78_12765, partial [Desulfohalobiaceae bacterium]